MDNALRYPWFEIAPAGKPVMQGDFVRDCPIVVPPLESPVGATVEADVLIYDVVVMSQSCDLAQRKVDLVLVCPVVSLGELGKLNDFFNGKNGKNTLRQGNAPGYHLLNRCDLQGFEADYLVVDFRSVYGIPFESLANIVEQRGPRICLLSPYREHLSQAFARFFMRVGLPVGIPAFT